jgi:hypothetical protein
VCCDNVSAYYLSTNPVQHQHTKHIEINLHFIHDKVVAGAVCVLHVPTTSQYADIFIKGLPSSVFIEFHTSLNVSGLSAHVSPTELGFCLGFAHPGALLYVLPLRAMVNQSMITP